MLLNMTIIAEELGNACTKRSISSSDAALTLTHAEIYDPSLEALEDVVYVTSEGADLRALSSSPCYLHIVCLGNPDTLPFFEKGADVVFVEGMTPVVLLALIQRAFRKYERWRLRLREVMFRHGTVADLLDASIAMFKANILVHDRNLKTIAFKTHGDSESTSPLESLKRNKTLSREVLATFMKSVRANSADGDPFAIHGPHFWSSSNGPRSLSMNIFHGGDCVARLVLTTTDASCAPSSADVGPFVLLGSYIESVLDISFSILLDSNEDALSLMIVDLLNDKSVSKPQLENAVRNLGWDYYNDTFLYLAIETNGGRIQRLSSTYPLLSVFSRVAEMIPESHPFTQGGKGFVLIDVSRSKPSLETICETLEHVATENGCYFSAGRPFTGLRHVRPAHLEAIAALDCISEERCERLGKRFVRINDVALPLAMNYISRNVSPLAFCPDGLIALIHYDNDHGTELCKTLRAYLDANCSPTKCARALFIQRSTFQYRFAKMTEMLGTDLEDPDTRLLIQLSLRLLDGLPSREFDAL